MKTPSLTLYPRKDVRRFVGDKRASDYLEVFAAVEDRKPRFSLWAALFPGAWMAWRKMYLQALVYYAADMAGAVAITWGFVLAYTISGFNPPSAAVGMVLFIFHWALRLGIAFFHGLIYWRHTARALDGLGRRGAEAPAQGAAADAITAAGGTTYKGLALFLALDVAVQVVLALL